jgi:hypothetical protein
VVLAKSLSVYSLKDRRYVGLLKAGQKVTILGEADPGMLRIRFRVSEDKALEAQCWGRELQRQENGTAHP